MSKEISRRSFLKTGTVVAAGLAVAPNIIIAGEKTPKKEKKKYIPPMNHPWRKDSFANYAVTKGTFSTCLLI